MTVKDLKELIKDLPDETVIVIRRESYGDMLGLCEDPDIEVMKNIDTWEGNKHEKALTIY